MAGVYEQAQGEADRLEQQLEIQGAFVIILSWDMI